MGTWDAGNFDNDGALDYVAELMDGLVERVNDCFDSESASLDEEGEAVLMPSVEIMYLLAHHCNAVPPLLSEVKVWRTRYLEIFDLEIDELDPDEDYKKHRREVIIATFKKLESEAIKFHAAAGNGKHDLDDEDDEDDVDDEDDEDGQDDESESPSG